MDDKSALQDMQNGGFKLIKQIEQDPTDVDSTCLQALTMRELGLPTEEIANEIGQTPRRTRMLLFTSEKRLIKRFEHFLLECQDN
ncbi:MAG: hypothetical protein GY862_25590 [Gammaproteobacteria bacterium]|nr:hypothetical protein [Gammaproteobacteria bacterium]